MTQSEVHQEYMESIRRVTEFVDSNLERELSVEALAEVALFSKFHFHRIFKAATGETLNEFVKRRRLEKAVRLLKFHAELSVTDVALRVGFQSPEHFSRSFKSRFDLTPREFKSSALEDPTSAKNSKIYQVLTQESFYHVYLDSRNKPARNFEVTVQHCPAVRLATISEKFGKDGMQLVAAYKELIAWAEDYPWYSIDARRYAMSKDDIEVTPAEHYRMEYGIEVPESTQAGGRISLQSLEAGEYALARVQGDIQMVAQGWDFLYKHWLPSSGYRPMDRPAVEVFLQGPEKIGWETFDLEIGFPVEKI